MLYSPKILPSLKFNSILPSSISLNLSTHIQSCPSLFNLFSPVHSYSILSSPSNLFNHIHSFPPFFNIFNIVHSYSILPSPLQSWPCIFNHVLTSSNSLILSTHIHSYIQSYPPSFRPVYHYSILSSLLQRVQYCQPIFKPIFPSSISSIPSTHIQSCPPLFDIFNHVRPYLIQSVLTFQPLLSCSLIFSILSSGAPLTYFNDGGSEWFFLGMKFWPKVILWGLWKTPGFFWVAKKSRGILLGYEKWTKGFFCVC